MLNSLHVVSPSTRRIFERSRVYLRYRSYLEGTTGREVALANTYRHRESFEILSVFPVDDRVACATDFGCSVSRATRNSTTHRLRSYTNRRGVLATATQIQKSLDIDVYRKIRKLQTTSLERRDKLTETSIIWWCR